MLTYCVSCKKNKENKDAKVIRTKNGRLQLKLQFTITICGNKKTRFVKEQEAKGILSFLGIRTPLSKIFCFNTLEL